MRKLRMQFFEHYLLKKGRRKATASSSVLIEGWRGAHSLGADSMVLAKSPEFHLVQDDSYFQLHWSVSSVPWTPWTIAGDDRCVLHHIATGFYWSYKVSEQNISKGRATLLNVLKLHTHYMQGNWSSDLLFTCGTKVGPEKVWFCLSCIFSQSL